MLRIAGVAVAAAAASALAPPRPRARSEASVLGTEFLAWGKTVSLRRSRLAHGCESVGRASSRYPSCIGCKSLNKVAWLGINVPKAKAFPSGHLAEGRWYSETTEVRRDFCAFLLLANCMA